MFESSTRDVVGTYTLYLVLVDARRPAALLALRRGAGQGHLPGSEAQAPALGRAEALMRK